MTHWLEEAENRSKESGSKARSAGFLDRQMMIKKNYAENKEKYDAFVKVLNDLIDRVNALPLEKKEPFGYIDANFKNSRLENRNYIFKSNRRFMRTHLLAAIWNRFKPKHMKHVRILSLTVSSQMGKVGMDVRDESLLKKKIIVDADLVKKDKKYYDSNRYHEYLNWDINELNNDLALKIIDWLSHKIEASDLPFVK
jgi:hypothetical protein